MYELFGLGLFAPDRCYAPQVKCGTSVKYFCQGSVGEMYINARRMEIWAFELSQVHSKNCLGQSKFSANILTNHNFSGLYISTEPLAQVFHVQRNCRRYPTKNSFGSQFIFTIFILCIMKECLKFL